MKTSLITGVPISVARIKRCKCGSEFREVTPAGWQQIGWGADMDSLFGDGPIKFTETRENERSLMSRVKHNPRCAIYHDPPSLRDPGDCNCGAIPPLLISVTMTPQAAEAFHKALNRAVARIEDPESEDYEWLSWGSSRVYNAIFESAGR